MEDKLDDPNFIDGALKVTIQVNRALPFDADTRSGVDCHDYYIFVIHQSTIT